METKICTKCKIEKELSEFYKKKDRKYGVTSNCKICVNKYGKEYRKNNQKKISELQKEWYKKNQEQIIEKQKKYRQNNLEKIRAKDHERCKKYRENNKEKLRELNKNYRQDNKEKLLEYRKEYYKKNHKKIRERQNKYKQKPEVKRCRNKRERQLYKIDVNYKITKNLRSRLWQVIKSKNKSAPTLELLGCTIEFLKEHLESQFQEGMSWDNYGVEGWHIDHIRPCVSFDLTDPEQQKQCFHYTNLQPLWASENLSKGAKHE